MLSAFKENVNILNELASNLLLVKIVLKGFSYTEI